MKDDERRGGRKKRKKERKKEKENGARFRGCLKRSRGRSIATGVGLALIRVVHPLPPVQWTIARLLTSKRRNKRFTGSREIFSINDKGRRNLAPFVAENYRRSRKKKMRLTKRGISEAIRFPCPPFHLARKNWKRERQIYKSIVILIHYFNQLLF